MTANVTLGLPVSVTNDPLAHNGFGALVLNLDNGDAILIGGCDQLRAWKAFFESSACDRALGAKSGHRDEVSRIGFPGAEAGMTKTVEPKLIVRCRDEEHELSECLQHLTKDYRLTFWESSTNGQSRFWFNNGGGAYIDDRGVSYTYADTLNDARTHAIMIEIGRSIERKKMSSGEGSK